MCSISTLDSQLINLKRSGKENVTHKPAVEEKSISNFKTDQSQGRLFAFFSTLAFTTVRNVVFHIVLFFCRRGRDGQRAQAPKVCVQFLGN